MNIRNSVLEILDEVLSLNGKALTFTDETALLGAIPELDSMAVVALLTMLEDSLGLSIADDEIDGEVFATVASLLAFVQAKLA
ncbi:phosphopantetheine-binding protein [Chitinimonas taiwanensis]|jgi:acyl carrier protein|uniref:Phosphopantetheine attachment site n=1 Tax=Chitinimonas taiwanensis DSM 18899 TaxID=1121279 RepID=A0A1K2HED0_9NEIS|nr:phosphopantetheine-binding protein [Chitinimonas taiwanensis]SFZ75005.1 Phosphopantetheine attachment site [Chitinimonas taiwanensis DSM 18899]